MTPIEAIREDIAFSAINSSVASKNIVSHPTRASMGQSMAGKGELVFEGELLEMPLKWHPSGTRH
jgi:hypothetical protein